jgi:HTH-type transcriptional regulator, quorum sensing regulator NprR
MIDKGVKEMGIDIGQAIKINRLKANMTQSDLASGIISISYLSKIENGTAEPPKEVIEQIGERLEINLIESDDYVSEQTIIRWFQHLLHSQVDESIRLFNRIKNSLSNAIDKQLLSLIEIHKLYYYVLINDMEEAKKQISSLERSSKKFNETEPYYFLKFVGNYHFSQLSFKKALEFYQEAEKNSKSYLHHRSEEIHNLYYMIATVASKSRQSHLSLLYSSKSLEYYRTNYDLKNCAECHILQGIAYQRINELEKAELSYQYAISIAENIKDDELLKLCYQNIGSLYSDLKTPNEAINYFIKSYELRKEDTIARRIVPISSLMKEYYQLRDNSNAKVWLELGMDLVKSLNPLDSIYVYEFKVYYYLIYGIDSNFEILLTREIIPFLEEKELNYEKAFFINHLAKYYKENRKYKLASNYFEEAYNTLAKVTYI